MRHQKWTHRTIKIVEPGPDHGDPTDIWEWCAQCGLLMCNRSEFFRPGDRNLMTDSGNTVRKNPSGSPEDPGCRPR